MICKTGIVSSENFTEYNLDLKYDGNIRIEPDNSHWLHIFHHNNPAANLFSSSDDFENGCYLSSDIWFNMNVCKHLSKWEFLYIQKTTTSSNTTKYRWIQTVSPYGTTYSSVAPSAVTRITTSGYTDGGYGGLYHIGSNTYMAVANSSSGNWYGATGCWTNWNGGIPGYPNTGVTSGYIDIYVRIDNGSLNTVEDIYKEFPYQIQCKNIIEI